MMRILFAVPLVFSSTVAFAQSFEYAVTGESGRCVVVTPIVSTHLEWTGGALVSSAAWPFHRGW